MAGWLELVFVLIPELIVLVFAIVVFPFLQFLFLPFVSGGGIFSDSSSESIRRSISLPSGSPGEMAAMSTAASR